MRVRSIELSLVLLCGVSGCSRDSVGDLDLGIAHGPVDDLSTTGDLPTSGDLATTIDLAAGGDAAQASDASQPVDTSAIANAPGLTLWLDAAKGRTYITVPVTHEMVLTGWADQSGRHHDTSIDARYAPTWVASATGFNGLPAWQFACAATDPLGSCSFGTSLTTAADAMNADDFYVAVVASFTNGALSAPAPFFRDLTNTDGFILNANGLDGAFNVGGVELYQTSSTRFTAEGAYNDGTTRLIAGQRVAGTSTIRLNGAVKATHVDPANVAFIDAMVRIGDVSFRGSIAEVVVIRGVLPDNIRDAVESTLMTKYAL
jgi:hypothetical protein